MRVHGFGPSAKLRIDSTLPKQRKWRPVSGWEWRPLALDIKDPAALAQAGDVMHDALFSLDDTSYDETAGVFTLIAWREVPELARRERLLLVLPRIRTPRVRTTLTLRGVRHATIEEHDRWGLDEYCLVEISYDVAEGVIRLEVMGPLTIELQAETIEGRLKDIGEPTWDASDMLTIG